jgi:hypothetical protein
MSSYDVAHIREQGADLIIIPLDASFRTRTSTQQEETQGYLQECATSAGLAGVVVPVWDSGGGRMGFLAPTNWHAFLRTLSLSYVTANINRRINCS